MKYILPAHATIERYNTHICVHILMVREKKINPKRECKQNLSTIRMKGMHALRA